MSTKTNTFGRILRYVRDLSIVIAGIALTFMATDQMSGRKEQRDLQGYLTMVKTELEENLPIVHNQFEFYDRTGKFAKYLSSDKPERLQPDSLKKYNDVKGYITYMTYKTSSFEVLKSSGMMRLVKDKELLKSIIDCYNFMESAKKGGDNYMITKWNELYNMFMNTGVPGNEDYDIREPKLRRLFNFFAVDSRSEENFRACEKQIKKTLEMF